MPQEFLDGPDVAASFEKMGGERVAQGVTEAIADRFAHPAQAQAFPATHVEYWLPKTARTLGRRGGDDEA